MLRHRVTTQVIWGDAVAHYSSGLYYFMSWSATCKSVLSPTEYVVKCLDFANMREKQYPGVGLICISFIMGEAEHVSLCFVSYSYFPEDYSFLSAYFPVGSLAIQVYILGILTLCLYMLQVFFVRLFCQTAYFCIVGVQGLYVFFFFLSNHVYKSFPLDSETLRSLPTQYMEKFPHIFSSTCLFSFLHSGFWSIQNLSL